jgi:hypothetical protein
MYGGSVLIGVLAGIFCAWAALGTTPEFTRERNETPAVRISRDYVRMAGTLVSKDEQARSFIADITGPYDSPAPWRARINYSDTESNTATIRAADTGSALTFLLKRGEGPFYTDSVVPSLYSL